MNDCTFYGWPKLADGLEQGIRSIAHTAAASSPYMQLDLGVGRTDILAIRLVSRYDCCLNQSQYLNVYISSTPDFLSTGVLCMANVTFEFLGDDALVLCPVNATARYVTVQRNGTGVFSLQEVQALVDGKPQLPPWSSWTLKNCHMGRCVLYLKN